MGILRAGIGAASSVLADQWREYFYCPSIEDDVLVKKGEKRVSKKSSNNKGSDNIISNGSIIAVNEGQCMIIVEQGAIVDVCAEAGEFVFDASTEPSIFSGNLSENLVASFKTFGKRFSFGGDTAKDQRIYFFNTKEIMGNKYGTVNPIPFRMTDENIGFVGEISIRCHGDYTFRLIDPILFYKNISGNVEEEYRKEKIDAQLRSDLLTVLQPSIAILSKKKISYGEIPFYTEEVVDELNRRLSDKWGKQYGITITSFGMSSVSASKEDEDRLKKLQETAIYRSADMAAAKLVGSQGDAMVYAAQNTATGPMMAFGAMNMAQGAGGMNAADLFNAANQQKMMQQQMQQQQMMQQQQQAAPKQAATWACSCGASANTGKFCMECGSPKPEEQAGWRCSCGAVNKGKFCMECGSPKPTAKSYKCDKCGWVPEDSSKMPKFCPECGDVFNENDVV